MASRNDDNQQANEAGKGAAHQLRKRSLRAAGISNLIADSALITHGLATGDRNIGFAGALGLGAGVIGARYGNPRPEKRLEQVERRFGAYLRRQKVEIPKNLDATALTKPEGVIDHIEDFLYKHPSQIMNTFYGLIGVQFARSATKSPKTEGWLLAGGCFLMSGALAGLLIKEKKPDPAHPPQGAVQKAVSWAQEKPLRVTGTLFNLNQVGLAVNAIKEKRRNPGSNSYLLKLVAVAGFGFGNVMMALSPKSSGTRNKIEGKTLEELARASALIIAAQPPETQEAVLGMVSKHLAAEPGLNMDAAQVNAMLHARLAQLAGERPAGWQGRVDTAKDAGVVPVASR